MNNASIKARGMSEEKKSLELAKLMSWDIKKTNDIDEYHIIIDTDEELKPYESCNIGLSQFAKIQLADPSLVEGFHIVWWSDKPLTQKNILDEILIINGVAI